MRVKQNTYILILMNTVESFFTAWALMKASRMEPGNVLTGVFFLLSFFLYRRLQFRLDAKSFVQTATAKRTTLFIAILFTLLYMAVDYPRYIDILSNSFFRLAILAAVFSGFVILFDKILLFLFSYSGDKTVLNRFIHLSGENDRMIWNGRFPRLAHILDAHTPLCSFVICLTCWLPYFLYQYPGIMTPDSINQFEQILGLLPHSNHHPIATP